VVAEGIENEDQRRLLAAQSVDTGQGFLFARPLEVVALDQLLLNCATLDKTEVSDPVRA
jgi:EAL domain-containing protein (putative c-di-GMP-specific phosphodiesterase class I)